MNIPTNNNLRLNQQVISTLKRRIGEDKLWDNSPDSIIKQFIELENRKIITKHETLTGLNEFCHKTKEDNHLFSNYNLLNKKMNIADKDNFIPKEITLDDKTEVLTDNHIRAELYFKTIAPFNSSAASYESISYQFKDSNNKKITEDIYQIINSAFGYMSSVISKPIYHITPKKIKIQLFFYWRPIKKAYKHSYIFSRFLILNKNKLVALNQFLSKKFNKKVELDICRLFYPYYDSNILANLLGLIINSRRFGIIRKKVLGGAKIKSSKKITVKKLNSNIPGFLSGLRVRIAGRVYSKNLKYKVRNKAMGKGTLGRNRAALVNSARFTNKNKRGAYSVTVRTGHLIIK